MKAILTLAIALLLSSCGGDDGLTLSGSGESGIGGTGISYVKGNVSAVNNKNNGEFSAAKIQFQVESSAIDIANTTVSGGGRTAQVDPGDGSFILIDVTPQPHLVLTFRSGDGLVSTLDIGNVGKGQAVEVRNVRIDYQSGMARAERINVIDNRPQDDANTGNPGAGNRCSVIPGETRGCSQNNGNAGNNGNNGNNQNNGNAGNNGNNQNNGNPQNNGIPGNNNQK